MYTAFFLANKIGPDGVSELAALIEKTTTLKQLILNGTMGNICTQTTPYSRKQDWRQRSECYCQIPELEQESRKTFSKQFYQLTDALFFKQTYISPENEIGNDGVMCLAEGLKTNTKLSELFLRDK